MSDLQQYPWKLCLIMWTSYQCVCFFEMFIFICGFSALVICAFLVFKKQWRSGHKKTFESDKTTGIFQISDQFKVLRVSLWIGNCHLCMKGHLKLRLQPGSSFKLDPNWWVMSKWFDSFKLDKRKSFILILVSMEA